MKFQLSQDIPRLELQSDLSWAQGLPYDRLVVAANSWSSSVTDAFSQATTIAEPYSQARTNDDILSQATTTNVDISTDPNTDIEKVTGVTSEVRVVPVNKKTAYEFVLDNMCCWLGIHLRNPLLRSESRG